MSVLEDEIRKHAGTIGTLSVMTTERGFQGNFQARGDHHRGWRTHTSRDPIEALLGALRPPVTAPATPAPPAVEEDIFG